MVAGAKARTRVCLVRKPRELIETSLRERGREIFSALRGIRPNVNAPKGQCKILCKCATEVSGTPFLRRTHPSKITDRVSTKSVQGRIPSPAHLISRARRCQEQKEYGLPQQLPESAVGRDSFQMLVSSHLKRHAYVHSRA